MHVSTAAVAARNASPACLARSARSARRLRTVVCAVALLPMVFGAQAWQAKEDVGKLDARAWLQRIGKAASSANFQGTMVFNVGGTTSSSRLTRYCVGSQSFERSDALDGPARSIFRHNQLVHTLWPDKQVAVIEQRDALTPFPALPAAAPEAFAGYDVSLAGRDRVAAHDAQVIVMSPRDPSRFAQKLWADVRTGLMLRADVMGPDGRVMESSSFTDLKLGVRAQPEQVTGPMHKLDGFKVVRAQIARTRLEDEGWRLDVPVAGFRQISCVKRPLDGGEPRPGAPFMVQSIYSDGLVHVSVFIEPFDATRHKPMMSSWGATHTLAQQRDDAWITVVGDVPAETIRRFASALEKVR